MEFPDVESFTFDRVRTIQKKYTYPSSLQVDASSDRRIREASLAAENCDLDRALKILTEVVETATEPSAALILALVRRSAVHREKGCYVLARDDARRAILLNPICADAYLRLFSAEHSLGQYGRAEVAVLLGLKMIPNHEVLPSKLREIRSEDKVWPSVRGLDGSDRTTRDQQNRAGLELHIFSLPDFAQLVMIGDLEGLKKIWQPDMKSHRFGRIKNPIVHWTIHGIQRLKPVTTTCTTEETIERYKGVIDFLFDNGVRLDARDKSGYTALMYAGAHSPQPELADYLLKKGADPDLRSVYGTVALHDAVMFQSVEMVDVLLSHGADPNVKDNDGCTPYSLAENFREIIAVFHKHLCAEKPRAACAKCRVTKGLNRCSGCRVSHYCGAECQKADWKNHKKTCKYYRQSHKRLKIVQDKNYTLCIPDLRAKLMKQHCFPKEKGRRDRGGKKEEKEEVQIMMKRLYDAHCAETASEGNLVLKIQAKVTLDETEKRDENGCLLLSEPKISPTEKFYVYNKSRSLECFLDPQALDAEDVRSILEKEGICKSKAYFWAFMESGKDELVLITDPMLPAQSW